MKEFIPLLQTLCWPLLIVAASFWLRDSIKRLAQAIATRIEDGDSFESSAFKLGAETKLIPTPAGQRVGAAAIDDGEEFPHNLYLLHQTKRDSRLDKNQQEYYRLEIWVDADGPEVLDAVESITYYLHPTFSDPVRTVTTRDDGFTLKTQAWGQFLLYATVHRKGGKAPLHIERYLNF